jgi:hypothetical protein
LYSLWDENHKGGPIHVLECNGQAVVGCLARNQNYIIVGGTNDGSIVLWDLRENSSVHRDKDSIDLKITSGIRKPAFVSSGYTSNSGYGYNGFQNKVNKQEIEGDLSSFHVSAIKRVECLDNGTSSSSSSSSSSSLAQFVTLDESGLAIFWITSESSSSFNASANQNQGSNINMRLGSKMTLIRTRQLLLFQPHTKELSSASSLFLSSAQSNTPSSSLLYDSVYQQQEINIAIIPNDISSFIVSCSCDLFLLSRLGGNSTESMKFTSNNPSVKLSLSSKAISCLAILSMNRKDSNIDSVNLNKGLVNDDLPPLIVVGRNDCTLELFRADQSSAIHSWSITPYAGHQNDQRSLKKSSESLVNNPVFLVLVKAVRNSFCFFVVTSDGMIYYFDLVKDFCHPLLSQSITASSDESGEGRGKEGNIIQKGSVAVSDIKKTSSLSDGKLVFTNNSNKGKSYMKVCQISSNCFPPNRQQQRGDGYSENEMKSFFEKINKHKPLTKI